MFLSRLWTLLLVIAVVISLSVMMLARDLVNREREESASEILYKELDKQEAGLTLHARRRLDVIVSLSADSDVRKFLASIARNEKRTTEVASKLLTSMNKLNDELGPYKAEMLLAIDIRGNVVVKAGSKGREVGYNLKGIPVVDAALRGFVRDDIIKMGKSVYMVAARPVIEGASYVGAILHTMEINDALLNRLSKNVQIAYYEGKTILAISKIEEEDIPKTTESHIAGFLDTLSTDSSYQKTGRSEIKRISTGEQDFLAIYSKVRGMAALNNVGWALVIPVSGKIEVTSIYEEAGTQDVKNLPFFFLIGGGILILLLGWFWNYLEAQRPISKLHKAMLALEKADIKDQLNVYKFKRCVRKIAIAFNKIMDYKLKELLSGKGGPGGPKSVDAILGGTESISLTGASFKFSEDLGGDVPPPPPSGALEAPPPDAKPKLPEKLPGAGGPSSKRPLTKPQRPMTPPTGGKPQTAAPQSPSSAQEESIDPSQEQAYFKKVFEDFVALKKKLGEPVEQLTFDRFEVTLKKNRDALVARYGCKSVKFNVYEKEGKASLKALPFK